MRREPSKSRENQKLTGKRGVLEDIVELVTRVGPSFSRLGRPDEYEKIKMHVRASSPSAAPPSIDHPIASDRWSLRRPADRMWERKPVHGEANRQKERSGQSFGEVTSPRSSDSPGPSSPKMGANENERGARRRAAKTKNRRKGA